MIRPNAFPASCEVETGNQLPAWSAIRWPQSLYGNDAGFRQVWLRTELQLNSQSDESNDTEEESLEDFAVPFFGSAAVYYRMRKSPPP